MGVLHEHKAGAKVAEVCRRHGITEQTLYRWKKKYGGMQVSEAKRLKHLEEENRQLKRIVGLLHIDQGSRPRHPVELLDDYEHD